MDKVITVIPSYRRPALLRRAILSVLNQQYPNLEVRVFDDASGDETAAIVSELASQDRRVKYDCQPVNVGMIPNIAAAGQPLGTLSRIGLRALRLVARAREAMRRRTDSTGYQELVAGALKRLDPQRRTAT